MAEKLYNSMHCEFFSNRDCEYFPCHGTDDPDNFNCLFCYCPLYMLGRRCGGSFKYLENGYKDCSDCDFPHKRDNYTKINELFGELLALLDTLQL